MQSLSFFAATCKSHLKDVLPLLLESQKTLFTYPNVSLATGGVSTYCYQANRLFVCGCNECGQLGLEPTEYCSLLTEVSNISGTIKEVIAGAFHTFVLTKDNRLFAYGNNNYGQLGIGDNNKM